MKQISAIREPQRYLMKGEELALLFLRVGVGVVFIAHGTMKHSAPMETTQQMAQLGFPLPGVAMIPVILLLASLVFAVRGGGEMSVDSWVQRARIVEPIGWSDGDDTDRKARSEDRGG